MAEKTRVNLNRILAYRSRGTPIVNALPSLVAGSTLFQTAEPSKIATAKEKIYQILNGYIGFSGATIKGKTINLEDLGEVKFGPVSEKTLFKTQSPDALNENTVGIGIYARTNESTVTLSKNIRKKIKEGLCTVLLLKDQILSLQRYPSESLVGP